MTNENLENGTIDEKEKVTEFNIDDCVKNKKSKKALWKFYISLMTASLLLVTTGSVMVWPSPVLPKLYSNDTSINPLSEPMTPLETSILMSLAAAASILGFILMAKLSDAFGRKLSMRVLGLVYAGSMTAIAFATNIYIYYVFFFLNGFVAAGILINVSIYSSEISEDKHRAWMGCVVGLMSPIGNLLGYIYGALIDSVKYFTIIIALPAFLHVVFSFFITESPTYLVGKKRKAEALDALKHLRKYSTVISAELEYDSIEIFNACDTNDNNTVVGLFSNPALRKGLFLGFTLFATQQLSGVPIILAYLGPIFNEAGATLSSDAVTIAFGAAQISVILVATFIVNRFGRRPLLLWSSLGCAISLMFLTFYFYAQKIELSFVKDIRWLPIAFIIIFIISYGLGLGPIPMVLIGELFRNDQRALGVATITISQCVMSVIVNFGYPLLKGAFGLYLCLGIYCLSTFIGFILLFFYLPETRGKSLSEIQDILSK
ncbi:probable metabolite transport protein CsbC [Diabrotica undecimpunctata]|uniref:probable metabolite transport protein CsbC n=1 Tax=Diabrotica undecimpunctata TaxID=50387 RepID=UPI003B632CCF